MLTGRQPHEEPSAALPAQRRTGADMRRLPAPDVEPPYDDEVGVDSRVAPDVIQGTLALAFALPTGIPAVPTMPASVQHERSRLRLVPPLHEDVTVSAAPAPARRRRGTHDAGDDFGPQRTSRALLPEPKPWAGRLVQAIVEVTGGARPIGQLVRWTSTEVYDLVRRRSRFIATSEPSKRAGAIVRSIHVDEPADGIAEVCAVVQQGGRCRAIALRLEGVDGRWQCTALQVG